MGKKFPRQEVIEKQLTVVAEENNLLTPEELAEIQGGQGFGGVADALRGQTYICYGVPRPPFGQGGGSAGGAA
jgi:hypothetical protein